MKILIITNNKDRHASVVAAALAKLGDHEVALWCAPTTPSEIAVSVSATNSSVNITVGRDVVGADGFDVIWYRRWSGVSASAKLHPQDRQFAQQEINKFFDDLWLVTSSRTRWVHSPALSLAAESKLLQLATAREVGFAIPRTLFGNHKEEILRFLARAKIERAEVVYKSFLPISWEEGGTIREMFTATINEQDIRSNDLIECVPGIYQYRVEKAFEVRSTFFGDRELSIKIDSQRTADGRADWRATRDLHRYTSPIHLPKDIRDRCLRMMQELSLSIACFDFIVDGDGTYYFLELNQQGQFLWVEECCPEMPVLDAFVSFLLDTVGDVRGRSRPVALGDVASSSIHEDILSRLATGRLLRISGAQKCES